MLKGKGGVVTGSEAALILLWQFMSAVAVGGGGRGHRLLILLCQIWSAGVEGEGGRGHLRVKKWSQTHSHRLRSFSCVRACQLLRGGGGVVTGCSFSFVRSCQLELGGGGGGQV